MAADADNKPHIMVNDATSSAFGVRAPESKVEINNLMFWHAGESLNNVENCDSFLMAGCEPVPADPASGRVRENFGITCRPTDYPFHVGALELNDNKLSGQDNCLTVFGADIGAVKLTRNQLCGGNHVIHVEAESNGGPRDVELELEHNTVNGTVGVVIGSYGALTMKENEIVVNGYTMDLIAIGGSICSNNENSTAQILHNTVSFALDPPQMCSWLTGVMQFAVPFNIGNPYFDLPAYDVHVTDLEVSCPFRLGKALQTYNANSCKIHNTKLAGYQLMTTPYDFTGEALLANFFGHDYLFAIGQAEAADYSCLYTNSLELIDNSNPEPRVFDWPTGGIVTCKGKMHTVNRRDGAALSPQMINAAMALIKAKSI
jgi:hypothetical protein